MVGTAGWSIPAWYKREFSGEGSVLERYGRVLRAVEINSSFYRPHKAATYERWAASVPSDFSFAVKLPKAVTHEARLIDTTVQLDQFVEQIAGLGSKLKVALVQLPPSLPFDLETAQRFFGDLNQRVADTVGIACEPRHASWFSRPANESMAALRVARVAADPVLVAGGEAPGGWSGLRYHRLHGSPRVYYSAYPEDYLGQLAASLETERHASGSMWCVFDNTASGAAIGDALQLQQLLGAR